MKFTDYFSPEKDIIKEKFNSIPYMDVNISNIVEAYIYENVSKVNVNEYGYGLREEYTERYGKLEGEAKGWYDNGKLSFQGYFKDGKHHGKYTRWNEYGKLSQKIY